jgi:hypothetical protein
MVSLGVCAALLWAGSASALSLAVSTIRWKDGSITRIGELDLSRTPTIKRVSDVFGPPTSRRLDGKLLCVVNWAPLKLRGNFVNLGRSRAGQTTCSTNVGKLQTAEIRGTSFRTQNGLRVGDSVARLRKLHPAARRHGDTWWLATARNVIGGGSGRFPIVRANVRAGKVSVLVLWIGAAGD